ncbi:MAG: hypothetical protein M1837_001881 [Sclerophora amabilis]|nr:MAG: hypothetical protein M1837_001881 [Sclerophora amabilis]
MSNLPPIQPQWAINETVGGTISVARGVLEAATSDNISVLALMSCESFGATLPLCAETRVKVEQLARKDHTSHVLTFIKAQIGYKKGDSVDVLSRSDAGVRFLCLASTFCTMDRYDAALRLDSLLQQTQRDTQFKPTIAQLQAVMAVLGNKLALSDFANSIAGWQIWCQRVIIDEGYHTKVTSIPSRQSLQDLVMGMSRTSRLGEECTIHLKMTPQYVPWTVAFVKWCIGTPPAVALESGKSLLKGNDSPFVLTVLRSTAASSNSDPIEEEQGLPQNRTFEVSVFRPLKRLQEIIFEDEGRNKGQRWKGMMDVSTWMKFRLDLLFNEFPEIQTNSDLKAAAGRSVYWIVKHAPSRITFNDSVPPRRRVAEIHRQEQLGGLPATAFPHDSARLRLSAKLLGEQLPMVECDALEAPFRSVTAPEHLLNARRPNRDEISRADRLMPKTTIETRSGKKRFFHPGMGFCAELVAELVVVGATLLAMSLLGNAHDIDQFPMLMGGDGLGIPYRDDLFARRQQECRAPAKSLLPSDHLLIPNQLLADAQADQESLTLESKARIVTGDSEVLFNYVTDLLGHEEGRDRTIISSGNGQVLYPAFFDSTQFTPTGCLQMSVIPGRLRWNGMFFDALIQTDRESHETTPLDPTDRKILAVGRRIESEIMATITGDHTRRSRDQRAATSMSSSLGENLDPVLLKLPSWLAKIICQISTNYQPMALP